MKKTLASILAAFLSLSLVACGGGNSGNSAASGFCVTGEIQSVVTPSESK
ncbi:MAG: sugar ABC transporter substrate-binding protein, partial [Oscillospiraceae bacterium]|nr:sugar ABC transporter substrate-binding protein [Oscillospiraceae bacterium]